MKREVTEAEFDEVLHSKNYVCKDTCMIFEPPVTFFWDRKLPDMAFGKGSWGAIQHGRDLGDPQKFFLHD